MFLKEFVFLPSSPNNAPPQSKPPPLPPQSSIQNRPLPPLPPEASTAAPLAPGQLTKPTTSKSPPSQPGDAPKLFKTHHSSDEDENGTIRKPKRALSERSAARPEQVSAIRLCELAFVGSSQSLVDELIPTDNSLPYSNTWEKDW